MLTVHIKYHPYIQYNYCDQCIFTSKSLHAKPYSTYITFLVKSTKIRLTQSNFGLDNVLFSIYKIKDEQLFKKYKK